MNKSIYLKIPLCLFLAVALAWNSYAVPDTDEYKDLPQQIDVGRKDPFDKITPDKPKTSILKGMFKSKEQPQEMPELFVETVTLKFLDAKNLKTALENMTTEYGAVTTDKNTNSIIICDTKENLGKLLNEIKRADKTPRQIMVEVVILDVKLEDDTEIGINWDVLSSEKYNTRYRQNFTASGERLTSTAETADTIADATAFVTNGTGGDFSIVTGNIRNVVHLLQQKKDVEILASPRVMMVSGQSASIEAVDEIPYMTTSDTSEGGQLTYYEFKDVGVTLNVTAILTGDDEIVLTVESEQNVQVGTTSPPRVDTRKAQTSLVLKDGQVVVFGGLRRQETTIDVKQIPILGDVPVIGELFKNTNTITKNSELVVFLSPHIYKDEPLPDNLMAKFNELRNKPLLQLPNKDKDKNKNENKDNNKARK